MKLKRYSCLFVIFLLVFVSLNVDSIEENEKITPRREKIAQIRQQKEIQTQIQNSPPTETPPKEPTIKQIEIPVILDAYERAEIYPEVIEVVEHIPFRLGERFKKGDLLIQLKNNYFKSQVEKTISGVEYAAEDVRVKESLRKSNLISLLELMQSKYNLATAQAQKDEALKNYYATVIIAPFDGTVGAVRVREYERPIPQRPMMDIFNDRIIIAKLIIPSAYLSYFSIGDEIPIYIKDLGRTVEARVQRIGTEINPVSGTVNLEAEIDNFEGDILIGMISHFTLKVRNNEQK